MQQTSSFVSARSGGTRYAAFAIAATVALVLGGCGNNDDGESADSANANATKPPRRAALPMPIPFANG